MFRICRALPILFLFAISPEKSRAGSGPAVEVVADLLKQFGAAAPADCLECGVRPSASAGGEQRASLFEHPKTTERPARVVYEIELPVVKDDGLLLFAFGIAIADGTKPDAGADGVRFVVEVDGKPLFSKDWTQNRWGDAALDLTSLAGKKVQLALLTHAIRNTSYDWAIWGNPRLLQFGGTPAVADLRLATGIGAIAVSPDSRTVTTVRLAPTGKGDPIVWRVPAESDPDQAGRWFALDFTFPDSNEVTMSWEPGSALDRDRIRIGAYPSRPRLVRVTPAQALARAGESVGVAVEVRNEGRGRLDPDVADVQLHVGSNTVSRVPLAALHVPALAPDESWIGRWNWVAADSSGSLPVRVELSSSKGAFPLQSATNRIVVRPAVRSAIVESGDFRLELFGLGTEANYARLCRGKDGPCIAVWSPLMRAVVQTPEGPVEWNVPLGMPEPGGDAGIWNLFARGVRDPSGGIWDASVQLREGPGHSLLRFRCELMPLQDSSIRAFWGPNLYVGDGTTRGRKSWGLFPGLEYLHGPESSSNPRDFAPPLHDRRTPHPDKYTIPLMGVSTSPDDLAAPENPGRFFAPDSMKDSDTVRIQNGRSHLEPPGRETTLALWWDPFQKWDGQHSFPSPRFASPNFDEGMENHRIGLFVPSVPDLVPENGEQSKEPIQLKGGRRISIEGTLMMTSEPLLSAVREWIQDRGGLPEPNPWPRSFQEELAVCRAGLLETFWDGKNEKWRHCIDWPSSPAPGFASLLWMDSVAATSAGERDRSRRRVELAAANLLRDGGPALFTSQANCHIMQWEFPFLYGCLPEAMTALDGQIQQLIQTQRPDGGWVYEPSNAEQRGLGQAGDSVLGTCANRAATILRYVRITGDTNALTAGLRALEFMERFRVPRGGQTWECPMYEPDILAAAYAIKAYVDGGRATGDPRWLHDAVYWAETGVPFIYLWTLPDKPMMLGATIPVFGSTFHTHSWLATPVQWCGLVYSYHVWHLAQELERTPLKGNPSPLPLALNFSSADWKRLVELITVSGMNQQFGDGPRIGAYPDSISQFEKRNPAFLNPEDILLNVLALNGHDPDVKTARLKTGKGEIVVSSGGDIKNLQASQTGARFQLVFFKGEPSHTLVSGVKAREVLVNGARLLESSTPVRRDPGRWWDQKQGRLYLTVSHTNGEGAAVDLLP